jgi:HK97 family phage major capsid protein
MDIKDRKSLLACLREQCGYTGKDDLAEVKTFIEAEGHELVDPDGASLNVESVWAKNGRKLVTKIETEDQTEDRLSGKSAERASAPISKAARVDAGMAGKIGDRISVEKKAYDARAKKGRTCFPDADTAEGCSAFLRAANAVVNGKTYSQLDNDLAIVGKAAASSINPTTGGVLVPDEYRAMLIELSENYGVARRVCNVVPMSRDTLQLPRRTGRFTFSYSGENTAATAATVGTDLVQLTAKKVIGLAQIPSELMDDSAISVADFYGRGFAEGIAYTEDAAFILGDGTSTYGGIRGLAGGGATVTAAVGSSHSSWSTLDYTDIITCIGQAENVNPGNCAILCSRQFFFTVLLPLATASGRGGINEFLTVNGTGGAADGQFHGWPVYFSQVMPTATASGSNVMYFGDFRAGAMFGDRKSLTITTSSDRYFDADQTAIRAIQRFDINVHGDGRGSTYGPIVGLATD